MEGKTYITVVMLLVVFTTSQIYSQDLVVNDGDDLTFGTDTYNSITVNNGGKVTFNGKVTTSTLTINTGGVMIVNDDLDIITNGGAELVVDGTLVVTGNLNIQSNGSSESVSVETGGVLVVGGDYDYGGKDSKETNDGQVYLSDPSDWDNGGGIENTGGDITDLIEADPQVLPDDILVDFVEESGYDTSVLPGSDWIGGTTDWNNTANWDNDKVPGIASNVVVPSGSVYPITCDFGVDDGVYIMWNLTLENGAELTIPTGSQVTVYGDIVINGSAQLTIKKSNAEPTSFIHYGTITGDINVEWDYDVLKWWYVGVPIANYDITNFGDLEGEDKTAIVYRHETSWIGPMTSYNLSPMEGCGLALKNAGTINYTGDLNDEETYSKTLADDWQMIANPYPAYYNLEGASADFSNTTGSVYGYTGSTGDRTVYTYNINSGFGSPAGTETLAPSQGFWVKKASAGNVTMRKSRLLHNPSEAALKSTVVNHPILRIKLQNESATDETVIAFKENGSVNYSNMDSEKNFNSGAKVSCIYSFKEDNKVVINVLPLLNGDISVQLGTKAAVGNQKLHIEGLSSLNTEMDVILEDTKTGEKVLMTEGSEYTFQATGEDLETRFVLHLKRTGITTDVTEAVKESDIQILVRNKSEIDVKCNWAVNKKRVLIYDINGRVLIDESFTGQNYSNFTSFKSGIYLIKVLGSDKSYEEKVVIK